jgi:tetratricopeptide (TPR) repeat protein
MKEVFGPAHPETLLCLKGLAESYQATQAFGRAIPLFEELLALEKKVAPAGPFDEPALRATQYLAIAYAEEGRLGDLRPLLEEYFRRQPLALAPSRGGPREDGPLAEVGSVLLRKGRYGPAEEYLRRCLRGRAKAAPDAWTTASARSLLGAALLGQKKYAEAAPLLREGYEGLRKHADKLPPAVRHERLAEAAGRLVRLYDAWGKKEEADAWRKKLDEAKEAANKPQPQPRQ